VLREALIKSAWLAGRLCGMKVSEALDTSAEYFALAGIKNLHGK
jgi:hypothetical protein